MYKKMRGQVFIDHDLRIEDFGYYKDISPDFLDGSYVQDTSSDKCKTSFYLNK